MVGARLAIDLERLRLIGEEAGLRKQYCVDDVAAPISVDGQHAVTDVRQPPTWRIKDAAYGLRWLEVTNGPRFDLSRLLVPHLPLALLGAERSARAGVRARDGAAETTLRRR